MESWQSGNAADSKSAEPMLNWCAGSNPVLSLMRSNGIPIGSISKYPVVLTTGFFLSLAQKLSTSIVNKWKGHLNQMNALPSS